MFFSRFQRILTGKGKSSDSASNQDAGITPELAASPLPTLRMKFKSNDVPCTRFIVFSPKYTRNYLLGHAEVKREEMELQQQKR